jgi:serine/threonine protein kinase
MAELNLEPGTLLADKYRIERVLGRGGMGVVALAYHIQLEQRVAIKLMLPEAMISPDAVTRFVREARAAARISSEHVARVFDVGSLASGAPYIAMEFLEGADIGELLARHGRLPAADTVEFVLQACEALAEAHAAGIVHRDLKPGNLYLANRVDGQRLIKVLDFGISKMTSPAGSSPGAPMTHTSALMGSPLYMSPEQLTSSKNVDARSDVWSLGVVIYEMLTGAQPFQGETLPQVCMAIMTAEPQRLVEHAAGVPPLLASVVERCLQKRPEARYQSVAELAQALLPLASARGLQSVERISRVLGVALTSSSPALAYAGTGAAAPQTSPAVSVQPGTYASWGETKAPLPSQRSRKAALVALASIALVGLIGGGVFAAQRFEAAAAPASSRPVEHASSSPIAEPVASPALSARALPAPVVAAAGSVAVSLSAAPAQPSAPSANPKNISNTTARPAAAAPKAKPLPRAVTAPAASSAPAVPAPRSRL